MANNVVTLDEDPFETNQSGLIASNLSTPETLPAPVPETTKTTTSNQDWAKGTLDVKDDGVYFTPPTAKAVSTPNAGVETVEGRLSGLLASESPYLQAARTRAKQESNARGLLNSTMAATAAAGVSNALAAQGNAAAAGAIGVGNALQGGIQNGLGIWQYQQQQRQM